MEKIENKIEDEFDKYADEILPNLFLGSEDAGTVDLELLQKRKITHILIPANLDKKKALKYPKEINYKMIYVADISDYPILPLFEEANQFISNVLEKGEEAILVHCASGKSRSASFVVAFLMKFKNWDFNNAFSFVKKKRPQISIKFENQLKLWEKCHFDFESQIIQKNPEFQKFKRHIFNSIKKK